MEPSHLPGETGVRVVLAGLELVDDPIDDLGALVLAELEPGVEAGHAQAHPDGALRDPPGRLLVGVETHR